MIPLLTYQDYEKAVAAGELLDFLSQAIQQHIQSEAYKTAVDATEYDHQRNVTVNNYTRFIAEHSGSDLVNATAANNRIASNFFHRLNTQRATYSLGNGVMFEDQATKDKLGKDFDTDFYNLAYNALIHRECFGFWNLDRLYVFPLTEFVPLYDEQTSALRAGIRFWRIASDKPVTAVLYAEDGVTQYVSRDGTQGYDFVESIPKRGYTAIVERTEAGGEEIVGYDNYSTLPIKRMRGSRLYQSTLVGLRQLIDSYDLIQSGFANDLQDCAQIYWIIENCGGMSTEDLRVFLNRLNRDHIATADTKGMGVESSSLKPYVQDVPFESRTAYLQHIRNAIYEGFGALDVTVLTGGQKTATEIEAAYQPLDENADDFEYQCIDFLRQILDLIGIDDVPTFKRNRVSNDTEKTNMILSAANYLDTETILRLLPFLTVDDIPRILAEKDFEEGQRVAIEEELREE